MPNTTSSASNVYHIEKVRCFCSIAPSATTGRSLLTRSSRHLAAPAVPSPAPAYREGERSGKPGPSGTRLADEERPLYRRADRLRLARAVSSHLQPSHHRPAHVVDLGPLGRPHHFA